MTDVFDKYVEWFVKSGGVTDQFLERMPIMARAGWLSYKWEIEHSLKDGSKEGETEMLKETPKNGGCITCRRLEAKDTGQHGNVYTCTYTGYEEAFNPLTGLDKEKIIIGARWAKYNETGNCPYYNERTKPAKKEFEGVKR